MIARAVLLSGMLACVAIAGCAEDGATGPQGAEGPAGPPGPAGPQGPAGAPNVFYSEWIEFVGANWSPLTSFFGQQRRNYVVAEPRLTQAILDSGTVLVYARFSGTATTVQPLPLRQAITQNTGQHLLFSLRSSEIVLSFYNENGVDPGTVGGNNFFRYIIIPGGTPLSGSLRSDDYEAVRQALRIP